MGRDALVYKPMVYRTNKHYPRKGWWYPIGHLRMSEGYSYAPPINWNMIRENYLRYLWDKHGR